jgi:hypothetical protein
MKDHFMGNKSLSLVMVFVIGIFFSMIFILGQNTHTVGNAYSAESYQYLKPIEQTQFKAAYVDDKAMIVKGDYSLKIDEEVYLDFMFFDEDWIMYNTWYVYNSKYDSWTSFKFDKKMEGDKFLHVKDNVHVDLNDEYVFGGKVYFTFYGCIREDHKLNCDWYISDMSVLEE